MAYREDFILPHEITELVNDNGFDIPQNRYPWSLTRRCKSSAKSILVPHGINVRGSSMGTPMALSPRQGKRALVISGSTFSKCARAIFARARWRRDCAVNARSSLRWQWAENCSTPFRVSILMQASPSPEYQKTSVVASTMLVFHTLKFFRGIGDLGGG